ncbi:coiled-coil domain-containing protein 173 [Kryptolebias marmoratus]|uniref:coiled-coil domain-containing protein 173 n=1 Tax=Kryptolebias marmoratus TaxID=37003 RepID=UPI0007F9208E|nr:coiled-coil domain-containing protein 173 [Kryptolebias marmoratus]
MASGALNGRRRGSSRSALRQEAIKIKQPPDLRQDTVLRKTDWIRVQDDLRGVNKEKQRLREAAKQREALHLQSKEVVKLWSNTTTSQRQKKLEAKKIREQIEEEERKRIVDEEANFKEQQRQEAIEKARTQMYYQTNRVKGLHSALLLTEVLKEREAQIELKRRIESASKDVDTKFLEAAKTREDEALKQEQEKALQRRLQRQAAAEDLKNQMKENELAREQQKLEDKKDGEEIQRLQELHQWERKMESERQANQKRDLMQAHLDHINKRALIRVQDEEKQEAEEEQRKLFVSAKEKMMNLRKEREQELFRDAQLRRERILNTLTVTQQERTATDEQRVAKAVAEQDAKQAQLRREEERKKSEMLKSITAHRELVGKEKEQRDKITEQETRDALQAKREADRIFLEKKQQKAEKLKEEERKLQEFNATRLAEKTARFQRQKEAESKFEEKNAQLITEEENKFHQYSQLIISEAAEAKKNLFPLRRAARQGTRGGDGPASGGAEPVYLVHDSTGAHMPKYVSVTTENIKKLRQPGNIQEAKKRLGFTW